MRKWLFHIGLWAVFFMMWNRIMYFYVSNELNRLYFSCLDVSLFMIGFYGLYSFLVPAYFKHKNLPKLVFFASLWCIALTGLYAWAMGFFLNNRLVPISFEFSWTYKDLQYNRIFIVFAGVLAGSFLKLALDRFELRRKLAALEKERTGAELTYLKAQLNPHFLFNSLNSLHAQMELNTGDPKNTLHLLADMLRYQLYDCAADLIPLEKELTYIANYVELQQLRQDNCQVKLNVFGQAEGLLIPPLLLIPFVENAFKHVSDTHDNWISIRIEINQQQLIFICRNTMHVLPVKDNSGIGLANVYKRLEIIYGNTDRLHVSKEGSIYTVNLKLDLHYA